MNAKRGIPCSGSHPVKKILLRFLCTMHCNVQTKKFQVLTYHSVWMRRIQQIVQKYTFSHAHKCLLNRLQSPALLMHQIGEFQEQKEQKQLHQRAAGRTDVDKETIWWDNTDTVSTHERSDHIVSRAYLINHHIGLLWLCVYLFYSSSGLNVISVILSYSAPLGSSTSYHQSLYRQNISVIFLDWL